MRFLRVLEGGGVQGLHEYVEEQRADREMVTGFAIQPCVPFGFEERLYFSAEFSVWEGAGGILQSFWSWRG